MSSQSVRSTFQAPIDDPPLFAEVRIGVVRDVAEARAVQALRYRVHVHKQGGPECHALPGARWPQRELLEVDDATRVWYAREGSAIVGTIAQTMITPDFDLARLPAALALDRFPRSHAMPVGFSSRFAIAPDHRGRWVLPAIARSTYAYGRERGAKFDVMATNPGLVPMFERLGYLRYTASAVHGADAGMLIPMVLPATDHAHLRRLRSPCGAATTPFPEETHWGDWLRAAHPAVDGYYAPDATAAAAEAAGAALARQPGLPSDVAAAAAALGFVHRFPAGTALRRVGDRVTCAFVALDGRLQRREPSPPADDAPPMRAPDGVAFARAAVRCATDAAVLCVPAAAITRLQQRRPDARDALEALLEPAGVGR